jgi:hypothetical protein
MRVYQFLKLDKEGLEIFLSSLDWGDIFEDTTEYEFSEKDLGLYGKCIRKGKLIKKGCAPVKIVSRIYGCGVIRISIEQPEVLSYPGVDKLYALVDFNYETGRVRRAIVFSRENVPTWMDNGFKDVNWEEIFI